MRSDLPFYMGYSQHLLNPSDLAEEVLILILIKKQDQNKLTIMHRSTMLSLKSQQNESDQIPKIFILGMSSYECICYHENIYDNNSLKWFW